MINDKAAISVSARQARNLALAAQGFDQDESRPVTKRRIMKAIRQTGMLQVDSVNVLTRAHYMPVFSRLGVYDPADLDQLSWGNARQRRLFEYWGHEASMIPVEDYGLYRWRMADAAEGKGTWGQIAKMIRDHPEFVRSILDRIEKEGALAASDLEQEGASSSKWWGWSKTKTAMEFLFWSGQVMARKRRTSFERVYDLPERIIGPEALEPAMPRAEAQRALIRNGIAAMGIATEADLRKYFRLPTDDAKARVAEMVEDGTLLQANVEGWKQPGYLCQPAVPCQTDRLDGTIRSDHVGTRPGGTDIRLQLPHRNLCPGGKAAIWLLRSAVHEGWGICCACRSESRPTGRGSSGAERTSGRRV